MRQLDPNKTVLHRAIVGEGLGFAALLHPSLQWLTLRSSPKSLPFVLGGRRAGRRRSSLG